MASAVSLVMHSGLFSWLGPIDPEDIVALEALHLDGGGAAGDWSAHLFET